MKLFVLSALLVLGMVNAKPSLKWYEVKPAADAKDARLSETHIQAHWEAFKQKHCKFLLISKLCC